MDGCINYPSLDSIRVSMISMPSNSSSYHTSCLLYLKTEEKEEEEEKDQEDKEKEEENDGIR